MKSSLCLFALALTGLGTRAQRHETFADNPAKRTELVQRASAEAQREKEEARQWAAVHGAPMRLDDGQRVIELMAVRNGIPIYYATRNSNAAISSAADHIRNAAPYNVNGTNLTVGVWDGNAVMTNHPEFAGRVAYMDTEPYNSGYHATHVGGTIGASGIISNAMGMVPAALIDSYEWNEDLAEMTDRAASYPGEPGKIYLSNHSYGTVGGWTWGLGSSAAYYWPYWLDWDAAAVDIYFGQYAAGAIAYDQIVYDAPYFLPFVSAGNDRSDNPAAGESVFYGQMKGPNILWRSVAYDDMQHPLGDGIYKGGYDSISAEATAKNIMTVGAVNDAVSGSVRSITNATMSSFSSWGPADDGRIKPDIVANGVDLYSCWNGDFGLGDYYTISGTSMSSPNACGSAALLVDYYGRRFPGSAMRASMLKGLIIHTAEDLGNPGPDYAHGWGLMNTFAAAELIGDYADGNAVRMTDATLSNSNNVADEYYYYSDGAGPIRATLCWTDPPGPGQTAHDNRTPVLINDLDLKIIGPGGTNYPYALDYANPTSNATVVAKNEVDNVEQVYIGVPSAGEYTLVVECDGSLQHGEQHYSLLVTGLSSDNPPSDVDMDGMPDEWELHFFGNPTGAVASIDSDNDGEDNLSEFISGHIPTNSMSFFSISGYEASATGGVPFIVVWDSMSGRVYTVNWASQLTNVFTNISGSLPYPAGSYTDTVERSESENFYRVEVQPAP